MILGVTVVLSYELEDVSVFSVVLSIPVVSSLLVTENLSVEV